MLAEGMLFALVAGAFVYTHESNKGVAKKDDLDRVERKVEMLYEHLLDRPMPIDTKDKQKK
jgi:hypothetical protein